MAQWAAHRRRDLLRFMATLEVKWCVCTGNLYTFNSWALLYIFYDVISCFDSTCLSQLAAPFGQANNICCGKKITSSNTVQPNTVDDSTGTIRRTTCTGKQCHMVCTELYGTAKYFIMRYKWRMRDTGILYCILYTTHCIAQAKYCSTTHLQLCHVYCTDYRYWLDCITGYRYHLPVLSIIVQHSSAIVPICYCRTHSGLTTACAW
jgi:hypothetical protein